MLFRDETGEGSASLQTEAEHLNCKVVLLLTLETRTCCALVEIQNIVMPKFSSLADSKDIIQMQSSGLFLFEFVSLLKVLYQLTDKKAS